MDYKSEYINEIKTHVHRDGVQDLLNWIESTDFFSAPASTRFHEAYEGGLVEHSVNVLKHLRVLNNAYNTQFSEESMVIVALFHDLCKIGCYKTSTRNVKDEATGVWRKEPFYTFKEDMVYGGHGSKSVYIVMSFLKLSPDEASAINCHMGVENAKWEVCDAFRVNPLAFLTHTADMASTVDELNERKEN